MRTILVCAAAASVLLACSGDEGNEPSETPNGAGGSRSPGAGGETPLGAGGSGTGTGGADSAGGATGSGGLAPGAGGALAGPGPNRTIQEYCQLRGDIEDPWCDYAAQCCTQTDMDDLAFAMPACNSGPPDPADCIGFVNDRIADGTVTFDGTWADACVEKLAANLPLPPATCTGLPGEQMILYGHGTPSFQQIPECRKVARGLVTEGGACEYAAQCAEGLACAEASPGTYTCQTVGRIGSPCFLDSQCADNLVCNARAERCATLGGLGAECLYSSECADGLLCSGFECTTPLSRGASCSGDSGACEPGTGCSFSTFTCIGLAIDGTSCTFSGQCLGRCDLGTGQCTSICGGPGW